MIERKQHVANQSYFFGNVTHFSRAARTTALFFEPNRMYFNFWRLFLKLLGGSDSLYVGHWANY